MLNKNLKLSLIIFGTFTNCLAQSGSDTGVANTTFPPLAQITAEEIDFSAQTMARDLRQAWWLRTGAYTAIVVGAVLLYRAHTHRVADFKAQQDLQAAQIVTGTALNGSDQSVRELEQKIGQLVESERELLKTKITAELAAKQGVLGKAKQIGILSLVTGGLNLLLESAGASVAKSVLRPGVKFMGAHDLDYYLYRTKLHEKLTNLINFLKNIGEEVKTDAQHSIDETAVIYDDLAQIRTAAMTVFGYLELERLRVANAVAQNGASAVQAQRLSGVVLALQRDFNQMLVHVQSSLSNKLAQADCQKLGQELYQSHVTLVLQLDLFAKAL